MHLTILACLMDSPLFLCFLSLERVVEASVAAANAQTGSSFDVTLVACSVAFAPVSGISSWITYFPASLLALCSSWRPAHGAALMLWVAAVSTQAGSNPFPLTY